MDRLNALKPPQEEALRREVTRALDPGPDSQFLRDVLYRVETAPAGRVGGGWTRSLQWAGAALALSVCAAVVGLRLTPTPVEDAPAGMMARGSAPQAAALLGLEVYRHPQGQPPRPIALREGALLASGDGLTFALVNRGPTASVARILVMDAEQSISWLEPAEDSAASTVAVPARRSVDLPEGVTLTNLPAGVTRLVAVFGAADQPRGALEKALQSGGIAAVERLPGVEAVQAVALTTP